MKGFKYIPGLDELYMASQNGEIYSVRSGSIMKQRGNRGGYLRVNISVDGNHQTFSVHRLVALAHLDNPESKPTVNHKNGIKTDNRVENLEWATGSEQIQHAQRTGLKPIPIAPVFTKENNPHNKSVQMISDSGEVINVFRSVETAAEKLNIKPKSLANVCRGYRETIFGYRFKYAV